MQQKATLLNAWPYQNDRMNLPVDDVDAALPFYETKLKFSIVNRTTGPIKAAIMERDGIQIGFSENGGDPTQDGCFFEVDNVELALKEFALNGLEKEISNIDIHKHGDTSWRVFL
jgi:lactoylglutathione lyase